MHLRITGVKLGRNLRKSGVLEIPLLFDVVLPEAVAVYSHASSYNAICAVRTVQLASGIP
jgi:hypothetical protein